jgi:hypothetical protein
MRGGPRHGAGRPKKCPDTVRDRIVRISVTDTEHEVLEILAEQWDVPVATAAYGLFADQIARCRNMKALAMPEKLVYAASRIVSKYPPELGKEAI